MPKKVKKKVSKKKEKTSTKQNVNVKIKIDQSRQTNPRQSAHQNSKTLPSRFYPSNASTPLHTTIMTATPSPAVLQKEPNYAEVVKDLFQDAIMRTNQQLNQLTDAVEKKDEQINQLVQRTQFPPTKQLYNLLMNEHQSRFSQNQGDVEEVPDEVETQGVKGFQDPNAKVASSLKTPEKDSQPPQKTTPVARRTRAKKNQVQTVVQAVPPKQRGRPKKVKLQLESDDGVPDLR